MSTPLVPTGQSRPVLRGDVVQPSAIAGKAQAAAFGLGQILKELIAGVPQAFRTENELLAAYTAVDKFIAASVPASAIPALADGTERAAIEDVTLRPSPAGATYSIPSNVPQIDYNKLAEAMVRAQMAIAAENAAQPPTTLVDNQPAPAENTEITDEQPYA